MWICKQKVTIFSELVNFCILLNRHNNVVALTPASWTLQLLIVKQLAEILLLILPVALVVHESQVRCDLTLQNLHTTVHMVAHCYHHVAGQDCCWRLSPQHQCFASIKLLFTVCLTPSFFQFMSVNHFASIESSSGGLECLQHELTVGHRHFSLVLLLK